MSTPKTTNGHLTGPAAACEQCGTALTGGRFCPECGHPTAAALPEQDDRREASAAASAAALSSAPQQRSSKRGLIIGALVGLAVIVAGVAAAVMMTSSDGSADTAYRQRVASAFGPVLGANRQVSDALARLRGSKANTARAADARLAVQRARQATTLATGAIGALNVPAGSDQLARDARQALDREGAYYADVARVLARPVTASTGSLQTLASNLTSALSVAGPTVAGTATTVSGSDRLAAWARAVRVKAKKDPVPSQSGATTPAPSAPAAPTASRGTDCGGRLFAGPNTSCAFAANVRRAWADAPGVTNTVRVFSPVTGQTYTMSCGRSGSGITCSGGNNASVSFDL